MAEQKRGKRTGAARKVSEALAILQALRVPREQQNERSALTLLALLGMTPRKRWPEAEAPMLGITEMMNHFERSSVKSMPRTHGRQSAGSRSTSSFR